ncbi:MAG: 4Fe-4S dicluster domain-containing protein [bacterium]
MDKMMGKEEFDAFIDKLINGHQVIGPALEDDTLIWRHVLDKSEIQLDKMATGNRINTVKPLKDAFFPQREVLFEYELNKGRASVKAPPEIAKHETVIIGARACDVQALGILDSLFSWDYKDEFYLKRRERATIVTLACNEPATSCFCTSMGGGPAKGEGSDILLTDMGDSFYVEVLTDKGRALVENEGRNATAEDVKKKNKIQGDAENKITRRMETECVKERIDKIFDDDYWQRASRPCVMCGICTFLCPTCHCFDIYDETRGRSGKRIRCWDTCASIYFTRMTVHNPRTSKKGRLRQRIYHKFSYYVDKFSKTACVGCGRCIRFCPVNMDITKIVGDALAVADSKRRSL